jgi:glycerophosphoryl diester phosphodiesterase
MTLAEVRTHRFDRTHPGRDRADDVGILEFREAVDFMVSHDLDLNVETKEHGPNAPLVNDLVAAALRDAGWSERTLVSSINHAAMAAMKQQHPHLRTAIAFVERFADLPDYAATCGADVLHPHHRLVDEEFVARARAAGLGINVWTVDDEQEGRRLLALDIDGMMTNRPEMWLGVTA